jgi:hypothetical protein
MPEINLNPNDTVELAEMLEFIAQWLSGNQRQTLADSLAAFIGENPTYTSDDLRSDLHRFVFLLSASDGEELFGDLTT